MDTSWIHPFTCVIAGPTGSGKTYFVSRLIALADSMITPPPSQVMWFYSHWQPVYDELEKNGVKFIEGLPTDDLPKGALVIIDDLMAETTEKVTKIFTKGSHHLDISIIYLVQNLFHKGKEQRTISLNSQYIVLFKNPRDRSQITNLAKQMYPGRGKYLADAFNNATEQPYGYLLIDLKQQTPQHLRLRTDIFSDSFQTVYTER